MPGHTAETQAALDHSASLGKYRTSSGLLEYKDILCYKYRSLILYHWQANYRSGFMKVCVQA